MTDFVCIKQSAVMTAQIQPPFTSSKDNTSTAVFLLESKMRSIRCILLAFCGVLIFGTVFFFGIRNYRYHEELKAPIEANKEEGSLETQEDNKNVEEPVEASHLNVVLPTNITQSEVSEVKEENQNKVPEGVIHLTDKADNIVKDAGSIFLKTFLKDMKCVMDETTPYSSSCCGTLSLQEDGTDDHQACILMDMYETPYSDENTYRLRFIIEKDLVIYEQTQGFPRPGKKCYPLKSKPGVEICLKLNLFFWDENVSDDNGYKTCTLMNFGYGNTVNENLQHDSDLLGYVENTNCQIDKQSLLDKSLRSSAGIIIRFQLGSDIKEYPNEGVQLINSTEGEINKEDKPQKPDTVTNTSLNPIIPSQGEINKEDRPQKPDTVTNTSLKPIITTEGEINQENRPQKSDNVTTATVPSTNVIPNEESTKQEVIPLAANENKTPEEGESKSTEGEEDENDSQTQHQMYKSFIDRILYFITHHILGAFRSHTIN
ncbi:uncharacterized protein LOC142321544 isoform X2 [Lycorma delicatula]|uniref:uncharacterized protein LOC142321544 isoform X2 n=1 Tax=Lycorma delicatula TaxID=130591 RepID=UPI003F516121